MLYGDFFMSKSIQKYIRENISVISKITLVYLIGVAIGIMLFTFTDIKQEYVNIVKDVYDSTKLENFEGINVITNGIKNNIIYVAILYFSLVTIIAPLIICFLVCLKAIVTGVYICTIFSIFGFLKGMAVCMLSVVIPVCFSLVGYIIICNNIILVYKSISNQEKLDFKNVIKHAYFLVIAISLISFSIVIEQLMTSVSIGIYAGIL